MFLENLVFIKLIFLVSLGCFALGQDYPLLNNGSKITISLLNYNVSDINGQSIEYTYNLAPYSAVPIQITNIPGNAYFAVVQAHSLYNNVTISYDPLPTPTTSVTGTNVGLWKAITLSSLQFTLLYRDSPSNVSVMVAVQAYGHDAPSPGGCNMEFPVETAPYLVTRYTDATVTVEFAAASPPPSVLAWLAVPSSHSCDLKSQTHTVYRAYLPEREFSPELYFLALQRMMTLGRIRESAHEVPTKTGMSPLRRVFAAYPGTGSAYVVVAQTLTSSAVYVPSFSYACDASPNDDTCAVLTTIFSKVLCAIILFLGIFGCFAGHRFFHIETLLLGLLAGGLIFYTALINLAHNSEALTYSVVGGVAVGLMLVVMWWCYAMPLMSVLLASTSLGYIVAALLILPLLDIVDLVSDINYWITYGCVMIIVPLLIVSMAEKANMIATSVLGAYAIIVPIDYYLGSNLRFILVNSIRRATVPDFQWAVVDLPFQTNDIVLAFFWVVLAVAGYGSQTILMRNKPPFPAPGNLSSPRRLYRRLIGPKAPTERTPLLIPAS